MKTFNIILLALIFSIPLCAQVSADKIKIPFDTATEKYGYIRIIEVPGKSAQDLYKLAKDWSKLKFSDDKFLVDEDNVKLTDEGSFETSTSFITTTTVYLITYNLTIQFKEGKSKVEITSIKVAETKEGSTTKQSLESFKKQQEKAGVGVFKKIGEDIVIKTFSQIDDELLKTLNELEATLKSDGVKKDDW